MSIENFVRYVDGEGSTCYGELLSSETVGNFEGKSVAVLSGDPFSGFSKTGQYATIKKLLCPIESTPILICIGANYARHVKEVNITAPSMPAVFAKPPDALAGPYQDISIHVEAQPQLDYEGELCFIVGRDAKNVSESHALDYVLGYTAGNDVSARNFMFPMSVSGSQLMYAKSFDKFAPIGPSVLLQRGRESIDPQAFKLLTRVNGEKRQETGTDDMIFTVRQIITHLSRGTTLRKGTVVMTGSPSGVALFMKPQRFLRDGDVVEVEIEGIGSIRNVMTFEK